ncbi:hypothetical protein Q4489_09310 [Thalassotalea sp. 1_MG-2023]|uniref:hypothetical protein n=1 Tax=Thalassotalea sp. 1_MG-2023 TaxID=3062680 RepID=UPI0026E427F3|nr:hypothetical protein [Thalassotalea sp. 1_MG-2023]MDO6427210.1 hypothetical protein [Thalassotalea sp. 1_MG-2023]
MVKYFIISLLITLSGCASTQSNSQFDFDHGVHFEQSTLDDGRVNIVVRAQEKIPFNRLATFLVRKSLDVCKSYGFKIEILRGVEEYDDRLAHPNYILPSLAANVECPSK